MTNLSCLFKHKIAQVYLITKKHKFHKKERPEFFFRGTGGSKGP